MLLSINPVESAIDVFNSFRIGGILIFREFIVDNIPLMPASTVPILHYGSPLLTSYPTININRRKAIFEAARYLANLGHTRISYIGDLSHNDLTQRDKYIGFKDAAIHFTLDNHPEMAFNTADNSPDAGYTTCKQMLKSEFKPTAIIIGSYGLSLGIPLTVVGPNEDLIANTIVNTLIQLIENPSTVNTYTELDSELVERASCAPPRQA